MAGRDEPSGTTVDPDDWFEGRGSDLLEEPLEHTGGHASVDEHTVAAVSEPGWLEDADGAEQSRPPAGRFAGASRGRLVAFGAAAIVLLLIVLAASGVFSGGGSPGSGATTTPPTTTGEATTPAPATTPTQSTAPASLPAGVLKPGASGAEVKSVQRALASAGQSPGPIDGVYGPKTAQAVSAFQRSAGITVDGVYGPQTKKALEEQSNSG
jgi:hypothetical protein